MIDAIIEQERTMLKVQLELLDILEPLTDEAKFRVLRAMAAYYAPIDQRFLDEMVLKRVKAEKTAQEKKDQTSQP